MVIHLFSGAARRASWQARRTTTLVAVLSLGTLLLNGRAMAEPIDVIHLSRDSGVKIVSPAGRSSGTGFFVSDDYVLTCFHVVAALSVQGSSVSAQIYQDLQVELPSGEKIGGTVVSVPTQADPSPLTEDFAFVKLKERPQKAHRVVSLAAPGEAVDVGDDVFFSGYPLATPGMVTHRGMVSGFDDPKSLIFIQSSVNKGNSGGGLLNSAGHVIGIVSMREGGISRGLSNLTTYIDKTAPQGSVRIAGVDPLQATKAIIQTLDEYISTGIGYARVIKFARDYAEKNKLPLK